MTKLLSGSNVLNVHEDEVHSRIRNHLIESFLTICGMDDCMSIQGKPFSQYDAVYVVVLQSDSIISVVTGKKASKLFTSTTKTFNRQ